MKYSLDTNACIEHLRGEQRGKRSAVSLRLAAERQEEIVICSIVREELLYGALRGSDAAREMTLVERFIAKFPTASFDDGVAKICARIRAGLEDRGVRIGGYDVQIAAIALAKDLTLVTHNTRHFSRIPGLRLEDWQ